MVRDDTLRLAGKDVADEVSLADRRRCRVEEVIAAIEDLAALDDFVEEVHRVVADRVKISLAEVLAVCTFMLRHENLERRHQILLDIRDRKPSHPRAEMLTSLVALRAPDQAKVSRRAHGAAPASRDSQNSAVPQPPRRSAPPVPRLGQDGVSLQRKGVSFCVYLPSWQKPLVFPS